MQGSMAQAALRLICVLSIFYPLTSTAQPIPGDFPLTFEFVDSIAGGHLATAIALDSHGDPHILYWTAKQFGYELRYAYKKWGRWTKEVVPHYPIKPDPELSIIMDPQDRPHICFSDGQCFSSGCVSGIWYGLKADDSWQLSLIAPGDYVYSPSLALDAEANPSVAYVYFGRLKYAVLEGTTWNIQTIFSLADSTSAARPSLAIDSVGKPVISFLENWKDELRVVRWTELGWQQETVDITGDLRASLKLDAHANITIAYLSDESTHLKFAHQETSAWVVDLVDTSGYFGLENPLALEADGTPHLLYREYDSLSLKYVLKCGIKRRGTWIVEPVSAPGSDLQYASLVLDPDGNQRWTYVDVMGKTLWYADSAIHLTYPRDGDIWGTGNQAIIKWEGQGAVDAFVSADGQNLTQIGRGLTGGEAHVRLPVTHLPIRHVLIRREMPFSISIANVEAVAPRKPPVALAASPIPYRSGDLSISIVVSGESSGLGRILVSVQDLSGRHVRRISETDVQERLVTVNWDGNDDQGHPVASGTYYIRAVTAAGTSSLAVVVLRP